MDFTYSNPQQQLQYQQQQQQQMHMQQQDSYMDGMTYSYQQQSQTQLSQDPNGFHRSTEGFPRSVLDRATAAKLRLENYYKTALEQAHERNQR